MFGTFLVALLFIGVAFLPVSQMPLGRATSQISINNAIDKGLLYLNGTQASDGHWGGEEHPVACTAMAVLAFENAPNSHYGWNASDLYNTTVQNGLDWLFSKARVISISGNNSAGNPDTNGNGLGIGWYEGGYSVYQTPMVLMAIAASNAPTNVTATGPPGVIGRTYHDIAFDIVDWIAWAQNSVAAYGEYEGGWRYDPQSRAQQISYQDSAYSDNSVSQWPVLGLIAAQLWGINASSWVKTELLKWTAATQNLAGTSANSTYGAFDYYPGRRLDTPADSAAGILELTYCGFNATDPRIIAAQGYLNRDWNPNGYCPNGDDYGWNWNIGDLYDMYAVMKAMREMVPPTNFTANYDGTNGVEWYNGTAQYADALVTNQSADRHWNNWVYPVGDSGDVSDDLGTAWGTLILEYVPVKVLWQLTVNVVDANNDAPIATASVDVEGQGSYNGTANPNGQVVFPAVLAGTNTVNASQAGYYSVSMQVDLTSDMAVTLKLKRIPTPTWQLTVNVVDSSNDTSILGAYVDVESQQGSFNGTTNSNGQVVFSALFAGNDKVSASHAGYISNSTSVNLASDMTVTLQLAWASSPRPLAFATIFWAAMGIILGTAILASATLFLFLAAFDRVRRRRKRVSRRQKTESTHKSFM